MSEDIFDQAAGLRRWAEQQQAQVADPLQTDFSRVSAMSPTAMLPPAAAPSGSAQPAGATDRTLMVFGPARLIAPVRLVLERWHRQQRSWVGHPDRWQVQATRQPDAAQLAQARWGLWINDDLDAFRQAIAALRQLRELGGPEHVLALHAGFASADGLLGNLRDAARRYVGIRLLIVDEWDG